MFQTVDLDVRSAWINVDMNSTVTCQNYFRLPLCSCEALINFKVCIKEANLPFLSIVPIYYSVSLLEKIVAYRVFEKRTGTPVYPNVCLQKACPPPLWISCTPQVHHVIHINLLPPILSLLSLPSKSNKQKVNTLTDVEHLKQ